MPSSLKHFLLQSGKLQAFLIHLGSSAGIVGVIAALMLLLWYPQPWFEHDGGWTVFRLILLVDVVLGPTLTLVVFRRGKPKLQRDLSIIVSVQVAALAAKVKIKLPPDEIVMSSWKQYQPGVRRRFGLLEWPALLKKLDRIDPSFRD